MGGAVQWCLPEGIVSSAHAASIPGSEHRIFPVSSHVEPKGGRYDGLAPMVCCTLWVPPQGDPMFFLLRGSERSTLTMSARGIDHAISNIMGRHGRVSIVCLTDSDGVWAHIETIKNSQAPSTIDAFPVFMALAELDKIVGIKKRTPDHLESLFVRQTRKKAIQQRIEVLADFRAIPNTFMAPGITWVGHEPGPANHE